MSFGSPMVEVRDRRIQQPNGTAQGVTVFSRRLTQFRKIVGVVIRTAGVRCDGCVMQTSEMLLDMPQISHDEIEC